MTDFQEHVAKKISNQWYDFGRKLGFTVGDLDAIESMYAKSGCVQCFMQLFSQWETSKNRSIKPCLWSTVIDTLRALQGVSSTNAALADEIQSRFLPGGSSTSSQPLSMSEAMLQANMSPPPHDQYDLTTLPSNLNHQVTGQSVAIDNYSLPTNNSQSISSGYESMSTGYNNKYDDHNSTPSLSISSPPLNSINDSSDISSMPMGGVLPHHLLPAQRYPQQRQGHTHSLPQEMMSGHNVRDRTIVMAANRTLPDDVIERHPIEEVTETSDEFLSFDSNFGTDIKGSNSKEVCACIAITL